MLAASVLSDRDFSNNRGVVSSGTHAINGKVVPLHMPLLIVVEILVHTPVRAAAAACGQRVRIARTPKTRHNGCLGIAAAARSTKQDRRCIVVVKDRRLNIGVRIFDHQRE